MKKEIQMKQLSITVLVFCSSIVLLHACKKTDNSSPTAKALQDGKWVISAAIASASYMGEDTTVDLYNDMDECDKDDFILYADDGTGTIDESTNKCADDQQVESFEWVLLDNDTRLAIVDDNPDTFNLEVSSTEMKLSITKPNSSGIPITNTVTYKNIN